MECEFVEGEEIQVVREIVLPIKPQEDTLIQPHEESSLLIRSLYAFVKEMQKRFGRLDKQVGCFPRSDNGVEYEKMAGTNGESGIHIMVYLVEEK